MLKNNASLGIVTIITSFFVTYILGFIVIPILKKLKAGCNSNSKKIKGRSNNKRNWPSLA